MMDYAERAKSCPHIVSSDEGTAYCALAEQRIRELNAERDGFTAECARLVRERDRLRKALADMVLQTCERPDGTLDSWAISAHADAMELLAGAGVLEITVKTGRRVLARWVNKEHLV